MKHIAIACGVLALSACAQNAEINTRNSDLPGIQTKINCNPEPTLVYAKTGQLIEKVYPILHPSCVAAANRAATNQVEEDIRPGSRASLGSKITNLLKLGPASKKSPSKLDADEDNRLALESNTGSSNETPGENNPISVPTGTESGSNPGDSDPSDTGSTPNSGDPSNDGSAPTGGNSSGEGSNPSEENTPAEETSSNEESENSEEGSSEEPANEEESSSEEGSSEEEGNSAGEGSTEEEGNSEEESSSEEEGPTEEEENPAEEPKAELTKLEKLKQHAGVEF